MLREERRGPRQRRIRRLLQRRKRGGGLQGIPRMVTMPAGAKFGSIRGGKRTGRDAHNLTQRLGTRRQLAMELRCMRKSRHQLSLLTDNAGGASSAKHSVARS